MLKSILLFMKKILLSYYQKVLSLPVVHTVWYCVCLDFKEAEISAKFCRRYRSKLIKNYLWSKVYNIMV